MKILGIDPGYERLGIAIVEKNPENRNPNLIFSETFKTSANDTDAERLFQIQKEIERVIKKYRPEKMGIETLFFNKNIKTAIKVAEARGIILACAKKYNLEITELSPQQVKIAVTGYGRSDKKAIIKMIPLLIQIKEKKKFFDDEYDAIAASLAVL